MADDSVDIEIKLEDSKAKAQASKTGKDISKNLESGMKGATSAAKNTEAQIKSAMSGAASSTKSSFADVGSAAKSNFSEVGDAAKTASSDSSSSFQNIASDSKVSFQDVGDAAKDGFEGVADAAEDAGEQAHDAFGVKTVMAGNLAADAIEEVAKQLFEVINASIQVGMEFDKSMSQVAATMGVTTDQIGELRDFAQEMGAKTAFSATQASEALNYMALAGYDAETSMRVLPTVLNLAAAGNMELAAASDMVTDAQSALGLSVSEAEVMVDQMAMTSSKTNTSVEQLGNAFLTVGGTAKNLKGGTAELAQMLGILADNGIKGSEGGTALRNVILSLSAPTDTAAAKIKELGLQVFDAEGNMRAMPDIMNDLNDSLSSLTQQEKTEALNTIFNKVDLKSVNALLGTSAQRYDEVAASIGNAAGAAEKMAETQLDNLAGDVTLLQSAAEGLAIQVSDILTPALRGATQFMTNALMPALSALVANFGKIAVAVVSFTATIAAMKLYNKIATTMKTHTVQMGGYFNILGKQVALSGTAFKVATAASKAFSTALKALKAVAPMLAVTLAVEAVMALSDAFNAAQDREKKFEKATTGLVDAFDAVDDSILETNDALKKISTDKAKKSFTQLREEIDKNIEAQAELADSIADTWGGLNANETLLQGYLGVIEDLTSKTDENGNAVQLNAEEQTKLKAAVAGVNEITGQNVEVTDALNGTLNVSTEELRKNTEQWIANAQAQAAQEEMVELARQQLENEKSLENVTERLAAKRQQLSEAEATGSGSAEQLAYEYAQLENEYSAALALVDENAASQQWLADKISGTTSEVGKSQEAIESYVKSRSDWTDALNEMGVDVGDLSSKLSELGFSTTDLANLSADKLKALAGSYKGSASEIVAICDQLGITVPQKLRAAAEGGAQATADGLQSQVGNASTWASHYINNFAQGLRNGKSVIKSAADSVLSAMSSLKFSVPKTGMWSGAEKGGETSGRHFVENFARGMKDAKSEVLDATDDIITSDWNAIVQTGEGIARGLVVGFDRVDPAGSIVSSMGALMAMSSGNTTTTTNNNTTNNWSINGLVASPDELFMRARVQERHGLAGRW